MPSRSKAPVAGGPDRPLDETDQRLLQTLRTDGRMAVAALAERVGISRANVYARLEGLTERGVLHGFAPLVDARAAGVGVCALAFLDVHPSAWSDLRERLRELPEVEYAAVTTGEHDVMLLVRQVDVPSVHAFVRDVLSNLRAVRSVVTVLVLDEMVRRPFTLPVELPTYEHDDTLGMSTFVRTPVERRRDA